MPNDKDKLFRQRQREVNRVAGLDHDKSVDELLAEARGSLTDTSKLSAQLETLDRALDGEQAEIQRLRGESSPMRAITNALDTAALPAALLPSPVQPIAGGYLALRGLTDAVEDPSATNIALAGLSAVPGARAGLRLAKGAKTAERPLAAVMHGPGRKGFEAAKEAKAATATRVSSPTATSWKPQFPERDRAAQIMASAPAPVSNADDAATAIANMNTRRLPPRGGADDPVMAGLSENRYNEILRGVRTPRNAGTSDVSDARYEELMSKFNPQHTPGVRTGRTALVEAAAQTKPSSIEAIDEAAGVLSPRSQQSLRALDQREVAGFRGLPELSEGEAARISDGIARILAKRNQSY